MIPVSLQKAKKKPRGNPLSFLQPGNQALDVVWCKDIFFVAELAADLNRFALLADLLQLLLAQADEGALQLSQRYCERNRLR